ncbi:MAG: NAD-dependent epimerase/dehydratase family protein [Cytophagales bacterium]|nr:NAD-dependent epimerase/dehydratase family protein [Cytophagales bacterium]
MKKILITGANGFIGVHLVNHALKAGYSILAGVRKDSDTSHLEESDASIICLDYLNQKRLSEQLRNENFDYIIHVAGVTVAKNRAGYSEGNGTTTANLLFALKEKNIKKFVFISSLAARGPGIDSVDQPVSSYGESKLEAEQLVQNSGLPFLNVRPTGVYGSGNYEFLPLFKWAKHGIIISLGNPHRKLSFIHVTDLCELILQGLKRNEKMVSASDGNTYTLTEVNDTIKQVIGRKWYINISIPNWFFKAMMAYVGVFVSSIFKRTWPYPKGKVRELIADDWSLQDVGKEYKFQYDLKSGFVHMARFYSENGRM